jgi:HK97 family phage prohead protease
VSGDIRYGAPFRIQEVKAAGDAWEVSGYASTWNNVDLGGDVVLKGAFTETLAADQKVRFLYSHNPANVLGVASDLRQDDKGLFGRFRISKTALGQDVHTLLKDGALDSFSIGYLPRDFEFDDSGVRKLKAVELLEVSVVAMPMNPEAMVTGVKTADYGTLPLDTVLDDLATRTQAALATVKATAERRHAEGRKLSDRVLELLESLRDASLANADTLLTILTTPPPVSAEAEAKATVAAAPETPAPSVEDAPVETASQETPEPQVQGQPVPVKTAGQVEAHLRRARIRELRRVAGLPPVPLTPADSALTAAAS